MTLHCENCVQPGQIGVAIGRVTSSDGLRILNFKQSLCKPHPSYVRDFYKGAQLGETYENLSCCRPNTPSSTVINDDVNDNVNAEDNIDVIDDQNDLHIYEDEDDVD